MAAWGKEELDGIAAADELEIAPRTGDGPPRAPTTIWVVGRGLAGRLLGSGTRS
jgi:hypothetical protein